MSHTEVKIQRRYKSGRTELTDATITAGGDLVVGGAILESLGTTKLLRGWSGFAGSSTAPVYGISGTQIEFLIPPNVHQVMIERQAS